MILDSKQNSSSLTENQICIMACQKNAVSFHFFAFRASRTKPPTSCCYKSLPASNGSNSSRSRSWEKQKPKQQLSIANKQQATAVASIKFCRLRNQKTAAMALQNSNENKNYNNNNNKATTIETRRQ